MSLINSFVLFSLNSAKGKLLPAPLWSKKITLWVFILNNFLWKDEKPAPGPPCKNKIGMPFGLPKSS